MRKQLISSGFIVILLLGWFVYPSVNQEVNSHQNATSLSSRHAGDFFQAAEIDVLNQNSNSYNFKVIKFTDVKYVAIFLSTLFSHEQVARTIPLEFNEARKKLLLACLYPAHEFS